VQKSESVKLQGRRPINRKGRDTEQRRQEKFFGGLVEQLQNASLERFVAILPNGNYRIKDMSKAMRQSIIPTDRFLQGRFYLCQSLLERELESLNPGVMYHVIISLLGPINNLCRKVPNSYLIC